MATFLITGASRGIGLELTLLALEQGHKVHALARDPHRSGGLNSARKEFPDLVVIHKCDVNNQEEVEGLREALSKEVLDVLINNAGVMASTDEGLQNLSLEDMRMTFETNCIAPLNMTRVLLPNLLASASPKVLNMSSKMGSMADNESGGYYAYRMSKAALNMFSKSLSLDQPKLICLSLHPGWVRTEMGGRNAPTMTRESARGLLKVIDAATLEMSGQFFDFKGEALPW